MSSNFTFGWKPEMTERDPNELVQMYNYPWSGKIHGHINCCLYCGDSGPEFQISSNAGKCLGKNCRKARAEGAQPIPELWDKAIADGERLTREWCAKNYVDYEATLKNYEDNLGPQSNTHERYKELEAEGKTETDYTVYIDRSEVRKITEPFEPSKVDLKPIPVATVLLEIAEKMVEEKRAEGWTKQNFADALKELLDQPPSTFDLSLTETVLSPEASARFNEIMEKGLAKPKITPKLLPTKEEINE